VRTADGAAGVAGAVFRDTVRCMHWCPAVFRRAVTVSLLPENIHYHQKLVQGPQIMSSRDACLV